MSVEWFTSLHPVVQFVIIVLSTGIIGRFGEAIAEAGMEFMRRVLRL